MVKMMKQEKQTALYCRISREDEYSDISSSIETQKVYLKRYAQNNQFRRLNYYIDDGYSGTDFNRPGFNELKKAIEENLIDTVITKDLSRLGRDYLITGYYIEQYFPENNVRYIAVNDQVDTAIKENDFAPFRNIMNEWYARDISKKIRSAYHTKALNGEFTGAYPPYGYKKKSKNKHQLIVNEQEASVVIDIFQLFIDGNSVYHIARYLEEKQILTPRAALYQNTGIYKTKSTINHPYQWSEKTIINILKNETYIGYIISQKHQTTSYKNKKLIYNPKNKWIIARNKHKPIIDIETFNEAQNIFLKKKRKPLKYHENIFRGKVRCDMCGRTFVLTVREDRNTYGTLECSTYRKYGKRRCLSHYITYESLALQITENLNQLLLVLNNKRNNLLNYIKHQQQFEHKINTNKSKISNTQDRIVEIDKLLKKTYEKYLLDKLDDDMFYDIKQSYMDERATLLNFEKLVNEELIRYQQHEKNINSFIDKLIEFDSFDLLTQKMMDELIDHIVVKQAKDENDKRNIEIYYKFIGKI